MDGWMQARSLPHLLQITDKQSWRGVELGIQFPHHIPMGRFIDTHRGMSDNYNSNSGGNMNEEIRKVGRPRKDVTVQAIEAVLGESQPSVALLAALVLPQIIATYGAGHVESNCNLAMKYAETLLTLDGE